MKQAPVRGAAVLAAGQDREHHWLLMVVAQHGAPQADAGLAEPSRRWSRRTRQDKKHRSL
jgi:hypothetical protein